MGSARGAVRPHRASEPFDNTSLYAYQVETPEARLTSAGFVDIAQRAARDSRCDALHLDARKPGRPGGVRQTE